LQSHQSKFKNIVYSSSAITTTTKNIPIYWMIETSEGETTCREIDKEEWEKWK